MHKEKVQKLGRQTASAKLMKTRKIRGADNV